MSKITKIVATALVALGVAGVSALPVVATTGKNTTETTEPTFVVDSNAEGTEVSLEFGRNAMLLGNILSTKAKVNGLLLAAGNSLSLGSHSEYGFIAGNAVNFAGSVEKDLFAAGTIVTIESGSTIGRDVFITGSEVSVETDLAGDLSIAADNVILKGIEVAGNLNITADTIEFIDVVTVGGAVVYNDNATVLGADNLAYGSLEIYHAESVDDNTMLIANWYSKVLSMIGLFVVMVVVCLIAPKLHTKIADNENGSSFAVSLALGLGVLVITPIAALILLITVFAAPLAVVALLVWGLMIYLSQGFAGAWVGHMLIEKVFKSKANIYVEAALGIVILGILSMVPTVGGITGFLGLLLGMGLMVKTVFSRHSETEAQYYVNEEVKTPSKKATKKPAAKSAKTAKTTKSKTTKK